MSSRNPPPLTSAHLAAFLEQTLDAQDRTATEVALRADPEAQRRLEQLLRLRSLLSTPDFSLEASDLASDVHRKLAVKAGQDEAWRRRTHLLWGAGIAATACMTLLAGSIARIPEDTQFRRKSVTSTSQSKQPWAGIRIYHAISDTEVERIGETLSAHERLLFSYTNVGSSPFAYLMIFAVDEHNRVYWAYPAYEQASMNPSSVPIEAAADHTLPDLVAHDFPPGALEVHALFTRKPFRVQEVERWLSEHHGEMTPASISEASVQRIRVQVAR